MLRLDQFIVDSCASHGDRLAVDDRNVRWTYLDLPRQIERWSQRLARPGLPARIGFLLPNSAAYLAAMYGAVGAGRTPFLIDPGLAASEIDVIARENGIDGFLLAARDPAPEHLIDTVDGLHLIARPLCADAPALHPDTAICRFTSGSGGSPKCLEFSHNAIVAAAQVWARSNRMKGADVQVCLAGFFNGLAFNTSLAATFLSGGLLSVYGGWTSPPQVLRHSAAKGATRLVGFPAFYHLLARCGLPQDSIPASLSWLYSAASALAEETREAVQERYSRSIINYYGIAEVGPVTTESQPENARGNGSVLEGCSMRVVGGEVEVATPSMATRYLNRPGEFESRLTVDGYLRTGDLGRIVDGRLFLEGRSEPLLDVGGKKFAAGEVRDALLRLPGVDDVFVFGEPSPDLGTIVCAAVAGSPQQTVDDIRRQLEMQIATYKIPRRIRKFDALPRNGAGKVDAVALRASFFEERRDHG